MVVPASVSYSNFGKRFGASFIDGLLFWIINYLFNYLEWQSKPIDIVVTLVSSLVYVVYSVYLHGRYGQTLGKMLLGIKVVNIDFSAITWRQAWLRSIVDILFAIISLVVGLSVVLSLSDTVYTTFHSSLDRTEVVTKLYPVWYTLGFGVLGMIWTFGEAFVTLTNAKRRSIHDFIAGTVVVNVR